MPRCFYPESKGEEAVTWKPEVIEVAPPPVSRELKKRWAYFIRKVYKTDPLTCPKCKGEMRMNIVERAYWKWGFLGALSSERKLLSLSL